MRINWKKLRNHIPIKVKTSSKGFFEILWADKLEDTKGNKLHGKTEFDPRRIILNKEQTIKETVSTAVHEWFHGLDHDHEMGLTEDQILKLEKAYPYMRELVLTLEGITKRGKGKK